MANERGQEDTIEKDEVKFSLFPDDVIVYVKHPNDSIRKLIQIINTLSKVTGYKINKYISSLLTNDRHAEKGTIKDFCLQ